MYIAFFLHGGTAKSTEYVRVMETLPRFCSDMLLGQNGS